MDKRERKVRLKTMECEDIVKNFYTAFQGKNADDMTSLYHKDILFQDPVFQKLSGIEAKAMWMMLLDRGEDLRISFSEIRLEGDRGEARWEAWYTFSKTGRLVHNKVKAGFRFQDDKIIEHRDQFSLWRWSRQAFGWQGLLLGWTPFMQKKIRQESRKALQLYMKRKRLN